jgi:N6-L-threonylcarbamoyladenine synthase
MADETRILGIESSCDETAAAVVADGRRVLSSCVASQVELHARFGGVVPEIASRAHVEAVNPMIRRALDEAGVGPKDIDAIAVTSRPGLIGSLLVGLMAAKTLAWVWDKPLIGVNHVEAHALSPVLEDEPIEYPAVALVCSGGHTALYECRGPVEMHPLGTTIDDAAGEAFDKVASILGLGYPGGPVVDRTAREGDPQAVRFPRTLLKGQSLDFSFSGLKTAVLYHVEGAPGGRRGDGAGPTRRRRHAPGAGYGKGSGNLSPGEVADIAASFQAAVVDVLRIKIRRAARLANPRSIVLGGGVSANSALREAVGALAGKLGVELRLPKLRYCVDNAAMIAALGYHLHLRGEHSDLRLPARATLI